MLHGFLQQCVIRSSVAVWMSGTDRPYLICLMTQSVSLYDNTLPGSWLGVYNCILDSNPRINTHTRSQSSPVPRPVYIKLLGNTIKGSAQLN